MGLLMMTGLAVRMAWESFAAWSLERSAMRAGVKVEVLRPRITEHVLVNLNDVVIGDVVRLRAGDCCARQCAVIAERGAGNL